MKRIFQSRLPEHSNRYRLLALLIFPQGFVLNLVLNLRRACRVAFRNPFGLINREHYGFDLSGVIQRC